MNFLEEAKREIEKNLGEVVRRISVDDKERMEIMNELRSTYYEAARTKPGPGARTLSLWRTPRRRRRASAPPGRRATALWNRTRRT